MVHLIACVAPLTFLQIFPGLGQSEFFYSGVVTAYSIGEVTFALVYAYLFHVVPYTYIYLSLLMSYILGSVLYAVASHGWMILVARFLVGGCSVINQSTFYVYVAEREVDYEAAYYAAQGEMVDADRNKKGRMLKEKMYAYRILGIGAVGLIGTGTVVVTHNPVSPSTCYFNISLLTLFCIWWLANCLSAIPLSSLCSYSEQTQHGLL